MIPKPLIVKGKKLCTKCKKWKPLCEYAQWTDNRNLFPFTVISHNVKNVNASVLKNDMKI